MTVHTYLHLVILSQYANNFNCYFKSGQESKDLKIERRARDEHVIHCATFYST